MMHYTLNHICSVLLFCFGVLVPGGSTNDSCSPLKRTQSKTACLDEIAARFVDTDLFWFGTSYDTNCPSYQRFTTECISIWPGGGYSLSSLIFSGLSDGTDQLHTYLDVKYHSPAGSYNACGSTFAVPETEFILNPLSDEKHSPFLSRLMPEVSYEYAPDRQYTLLILDAASTPVHGLYLNIPGDDLSSDSVTAIKSYSGPLNARARGNLYVFMVFEQMAKDLSLNDTYIAHVMEGFNINKNWSQIFYDMYLTGPIGINWLYADYDPYSVEAQYIRFNGLMNCAPFVQEVLMSHDRPFIPDDTSLSVFMTVRIHNQPLSFAHCCKQATYSESEVQLDPLSDELVKSARVRTGNSVKVSVVMNKSFPNITGDFIGRKYTLICVDPDVPFPEAGTQSRPLLHMAGINAHVVDGVVEFGTVLADYIGPMPPDDKPHTYYFLMYEQLDGEVDLNDTMDYVGTECRDSLRTRCLFDVNKFTTDNNLHLVAASWMVVERDIYVNYVRGADDPDACLNEPGYSKPCMTKTSGAQLGAIQTIWVVLFFCIIGVTGI